MYTFRFLLLAIQTVHTRTRLKMRHLTIFPFIIMILMDYTSTHGFVHIQLAHNQSRSVQKINLNVSLHGFCGTGNHRCIEYMNVTVKVTKICGKKGI